MIVLPSAKSCATSAIALIGRSSRRATAPAISSTVPRIAATTRPLRSACIRVPATTGSRGTSTTLNHGAPGTGAKPTIALPSPAPSLRSDPVPSRRIVRSSAASSALRPGLAPCRASTAPSWSTIITAGPSGRPLTRVAGGRNRARSTTPASAPVRRPRSSRNAVASTTVEAPARAAARRRVDRDVVPRRDRAQPRRRRIGRVAGGHRQRRARDASAGVDQGQRVDPDRQAARVAGERNRAGAALQRRERCLGGEFLERLAHRGELVLRPRWRRCAQAAAPSARRLPARARRRSSTCTPARRKAGSRPPAPARPCTRRRGGT